MTREPGDTIQPPALCSRLDGTCYPWACSVTYKKSRKEEKGKENGTVRTPQRERNTDEAAPSAADRGWLQGRPGGDSRKHVQAPCAPGYRQLAGSTGPSFLWLRWYCSYQLRCGWLCPVKSLCWRAQAAATRGQCPQVEMTSRGEQGDALGRTASPPRTQALSACPLSFCKRSQSCPFAQLLLLPPTSLFFLLGCILALPPIAAKMAEGAGQAGSQGRSGPKVPSFPARHIASENRDGVTAVHTVGARTSLQAGHYVLV